MGKGFNYDNLINAIERLESCRYSCYNLTWCSDCVCWLWKWRKISKEQMEDCAARISKLFEIGAN